MKESRTSEQQKKKILYAASTSSHLRRFHMPYIEALRRDADVFLMANGEGMDHAIPFRKNFFSPANLRAVIAIRRILRREGFDQVILNTSLAAFLVRAAMVGMRRRPEVLNIVHGYLFHDPPQGKKERFLLLCEKMMWRRTDRIAVMNAEDLAITGRYRLCRGRVAFIKGMGFRSPHTLPGPDAALRARFAPEADDRLLTFVGELSGRKNQSFLIRALARLRGEGMPLRLLLVGEGAEREALERETARLGLSDSVFLIGNQEPVFPYLALTDLYVSASRIEGLAFNLMEAMAAGLPVLVSDVKGQKDLLSGRAECMYPAGDEEAFCRGVRQWFASGVRGAGAVCYPELEAYRLDAVLEDDLRVMKGETII